MQQRTKLGLIAIGLLLAIRFVFQPWYTWANEQASQIAALKMNYQRLSGAIERGTQLFARQQSIETDYQQLDKLWYKGNRANVSVNVLQHLEQIAKRYKVELSTRNTGQLVSDGANVIPASLFVRGRPQAIYGFLAAVETSQPVAVLSSVRLTKGSAASNEITGIFDLQVLVKPEEAQ